jgi:predicted nucleic acid-binding protein
MLTNILSVKRIYLDVCALCRPFDDQRQIRIALETQAVHLILSQVRLQRFELLLSPAHEAEILAIRDRQERDELLLLLQQVGTTPAYDLAGARLRTQHLKQQGLKVADAVHLALAEQVSDVLITVDDRFLKFCRRTNIPLWCTTPPQFCEQENLR